MPEFEPPECAAGHEPARMSFLEAVDPMDDGSGVDEADTDWREKWRYSCPDCGRVVEVRETVESTFEEHEVRESEETRGDPTSLSPVADWD